MLQHGGFVEHPQQGHLFFFRQLGIVDADLSHQDIHAHPEFPRIVFHGLRHSSATYQLIESGGNIKAVQGNTGHATTGILMDTYAHTQDKPRLELAEKLEADFYSQDIGSPKSGSVPVKENLPDSIQITPEGMLKVVRQMNPEQRREFTRLLFA